MLNNFVSGLAMINQEDGTIPGPALSALETVITFVIVPTVLFLVISLLSYAATAERKKSEKSVITHIE
jgi:large-conductance mechanosensitive channel